VTAPVGSEILSKAAAMFSGVRSASGKYTPSVSVIRVRAKEPAPAQSITREGACRDTRNNTPGVIDSGVARAATASDSRPSVIRVAAVGRSVLTRISCFSPSR
jgi:hypothetical protein